MNRMLMAALLTSVVSVSVVSGYLALADSDDSPGCEASDEYSPFVYEHDGKEYYALETSGTCGIGCTYSEYRPTMAIGAAFTGIQTT